MREHLTAKVLEATEKGWVPDAIVRLGIRRLCAERLALECGWHERHSTGATEELHRTMSEGPIALATSEANLQHYEQPADLFVHTLGPRLKYSCCYWPDGTSMLPEAENRALEETCRRAQIDNGMDILELGCGWGSLTLWVAEKYRNIRITAVSNSSAQKRYIERVAGEQGLRNIRVITADINRFEISERFDRVVSVEMFEHMNNYRELLRRVAGWMRDDGFLFLHVFAHRRYAYKYQTEGSGNWMARNFFTGGVMPSVDLLTRFQESVRVVDRWWWSGLHYSRTAEAWLKNMAKNREILLQILAEVHGRKESAVWYQRWRMFYLACAELWGYRDGTEWGVAHYLFERQTSGRVVRPGFKPVS